jgi:hypothetical protein
MFAVKLAKFSRLIEETKGHGKYDELEYLHDMIEKNQVPKHYIKPLLKVAAPILESKCFYRKPAAEYEFTTDRCTKLRFLIHMNEHVFTAEEYAKLSGAMGKAQQNAVFN